MTGSAFGLYVWLCFTGVGVGFNLWNVQHQPDALPRWLWLGLSIAVFATSVVQFAAVLP